MTKYSLKKLALIVLALPTCLLADAAQMCGQQPLQTVMKQCATSTDACANIIKYNCLSANRGTAALQLNQLHSAMASQFTKQILQGNAAVSATNIVTAPQNNSTVNQIVHNQSALVEKEQNHARPAVQTSQPKAANKTNFWF